MRIVKPKAHDDCFYTKEQMDTTNFLRGFGFLVGRSPTVRPSILALAFVAPGCEANMTLNFRVLLVYFILQITAGAANYVVVNNSDSGAGSLRQAILNANASGGGTITFANVTGSISLQSPLPMLTANIKIQGPGYSQLAIVCSNTIALSILTNSANSTSSLSGLTIQSTMANFGGFTLLDSFVGPQFHPGPAPVYNSGTMTLSRCIFTGNQITDNTDSIENHGTMNLDQCSITNNRGGGSVYNSGNLTMDNSVVAGHRWFTSSLGGLDNDGGIVVLRNCAISNNWSVQGGGIWNGGALFVTNSLISSNQAMYSDIETPAGGLYNIGYAVLVNTTVSGNRAAGAAGGIWNSGGLRLLNCTVVSNFVFGNIYNRPTSGGGVWNWYSDIDIGIFQCRNTIIAGNHSTLTNCTYCPDDISGYMGSFGHNLVQNANGWLNAGSEPSDLVGIDPKLGPLQDNGGATMTHALLTGSPAIDAGDSTGAPSEDQRGVPRPQGRGVDIGAFEYLPATAIFTRIVVLSKTNLLIVTFAAPSRNYFVQASQDLISWNNIAVLTVPPNGVLQYTNPITVPRRFFRVRPQ